MTRNNKEEAPQKPDRANPQVEIVYYTDPLCCWSWAFEPQWRRLRYEYGKQLQWRYRMGGLLPDWNSYNDPMNLVSKPLHMGPVWMEAQHLSGMPIRSRIWFEDPPVSSFPACMAVKCAELQSAEAAEIMLRRLREAVMLQGRNISKHEVLLQVAAEMAAQEPELLNLKQFTKELLEEEVRNKFREDLQEARLLKIGRFPTLTLTGASTDGVMIVGYRPYQALVQALEQVAPGIQPLRKVTDAEAYQSYWSGTLTERELAEVAEGKTEPVTEAALP